jgi:hypothetical protein
MRKAISITLKADNLLWLRGQAARSAKGSVSEVLDRLVSDARASGKTDPAAVRSVAGTIDLPEDDSDLAGADAYIRSLFAASTHEPMLVRERPPRATPGKAQPASPKRGAVRGAKAGG